jgi:hypothetical protein
MKDFDTPLDQALYALVHTNGGAVKIAQLDDVSIPAGTLNNKADDKKPTHQFSPAQLVEVMNGTKDYRPLLQMATECHHICLPNHNLTDISDKAFLEVYTNAMAKVGDMAHRINGAFEDYVITSDEVNDVQEGCINAAAVILQLPDRLRGMADA